MHPSTSVGFVLVLLVASLITLATFFADLKRATEHSDGASAVGMALGVSLRAVIYSAVIYAAWQ